MDPQNICQYQLYLISIDDLLKLPEGEGNLLLLTLLLLLLIQHLLQAGTEGLVAPQTWPGKSGNNQDSAKVAVDVL